MSTNRRAMPCLALLCAAVAALPAIAQESPSPGAPAERIATDPPSPVSPAERIATDPASPVPPGGNPSPSGMQFSGAELQDVLQAFSARYGLTFATGPEIRGKRVTLLVGDVPWQVALRQVLDSCDCTYVKDGDILRVVPKGRAAAPPARAAAVPSPSPVAIAEELPSEPGPAPSPVVGIKAPRPVGTPAAAGRVTFDFKDADLVNILRIFSMRYGINIIAGPEVQGKVTIRLVDVPWETALKLILESNNYSYVKQQNVFRVLSRDQLDKEPMETKIFALSYAQAKDVANSISHLLTPGRGLLKPDDRSNTLVVTDIPKKLNEIEEVIYRLDRRTPQVMIEARILELKDDFDENIGINWVTLKGYNVTLGPPEGEGFFSWKREDVNTKVDQTDRTYRDRNITRTEKQSGVGQMGNEDAFGTTSDTGTTTTTVISTVPGTDSGTTITTITPQRVNENLTGSIFEDYYKAEGLDNRNNTTTTTELTQAVLTPDSLQLTLNFLQEQADANLISHPKLVTADNKDSTIKVAEQWPIPKFQFNNDTGQWEISDFQYKDIGIILKVKPHVNEDDFVNMKVVPEVSDITSFTTFGGATSAQLPIISTRTAETDVLIRNGQTLAIGGLMREDETDSVTKLPLLGEIPLMGPYLFANSSKIIRNRNIIIFVTANVVTEENKDSLWIGQREAQNKQLNIPKTKWWEPKKLRHGLGSQPGY